MNRSVGSGIGFEIALCFVCLRCGPSTSANKEGSATAANPGKVETRRDDKGEGLKHRLPEEFPVAAAISPDNKLAAVVYDHKRAGYPAPENPRTVAVWDVATGKRLWVASKGKELDVDLLKFFPDSKRLLVRSHDSLKEVDALTGKVLGTFQKDARKVTCFTFSKDGRFLLTGDADGWLHFLSASGGTPIRTFRGGESPIVYLTLSPDGGRALFGFQFTVGEPNELCLCDTNTGKELHAFAQGDGWMQPVAFAPDGKSALIGYREKTTKASWIARCSLPDGKIIRKFPRRKGNALVVSANGKEVRCVSWPPARLTRFDLANGKELKSLSLVENPRVVSLSSDGSVILTTGFWCNPPDDFAVELWDGVTGERLRVLSTEG